MSEAFSYYSDKYFIDKKNKRKKIIVYTMRCEFERIAVISVQCWTLMDE